MIIKQLLFTSVLVSFALAKVPSYIKVCGRRNPNLDQCVLNSVLALRDKLRQGMPELDVPSIDPFQVDELLIADMPNFKAIARNATVYGLSTFEIQSLDINLETHTLEIQILNKEINLVGRYDINAMILVPIIGKGPIKLSTADLVSVVKLQSKIVESGGTNYTYYSSMTLDMQIKDYDSQIGLDSGSSTLQQAINQILGDNHQEIIKVIKPSLEKSIAQQVLVMANKICKHFTYDELFPDRE